MGLGENFFWGSDQTTGTTGTTASGWLSLFWLFRTACYLNSAPLDLLHVDKVADVQVAAEKRHEDGARPLIAR